jgi:excisionase family DNA binding protein
LTERSSGRRDARRSGARVTVSEAAALLGISKEAVRMRIRRGTLRSEKTDDRVYVWLDNDVNVDQDAVHYGAGTTPSADPRDQLIMQLRSEVEAWREEARRKDHIIMNMTEVMKALSPPTEPPESVLRPTEREDRGDILPNGNEARTGGLRQHSSARHVVEHVAGHLLTYLILAVGGAVLAGFAYLLQGPADVLTFVAAGALGLLGLATALFMMHHERVVRGHVRPALYVAVVWQALVVLVSLGGAWFSR